MKIYTVGGFIRDTLLGIEPKDKDFVVVGSSPEEMLELGMVQVGSDFPVFLHPETGDEVALARIERKVGVGYNGFDTDWKGVTLEEDLSRRDLTINSMAREVDGFINPQFIGNLIDPFGGYDDLRYQLLTPTSEAFVEDPVRILRAARFLARYPEFQWTLDLGYSCKDASYDLVNVPPERIWAETQKALTETNPSRYFDFLGLVIGKDVIFQDLYKLVEAESKNEFHQEDNAYVHTMMVVKYAKEHFNDPEITFAGIMHDLGKAPCFLERGTMHGHEEEGIPYVEEFCKQYKVPNSYRDLALITTRHHLKVHNVLGRGKNAPTKPKTIMKLFEDTNSLKKVERFHKMLKACEADARGRIGVAAEEEYIQADYLIECLQAVADFNTKDLSKRLLSEGKEGKMIGEFIRQERIAKIRGVQNKWKEKANENR